MPIFRGVPGDSAVSWKEGADNGAGTGASRDIGRGTQRRRWGGVRFAGRGVGADGWHLAAAVGLGMRVHSRANSLLSVGGWRGLESPGLMCTPARSQ